MYLWTRLVLVGFFKHSEDILGGVAVAAIRVAVSGSEAENEGSEVSSMPPELKNGDRPTGSVANGEERVTPIRRRALTASFARASQATTLSNDEALEVMFDLLYQPGGYQRVIQISGELSRTLSLSGRTTGFILLPPSASRCIILRRGLTIDCQPVITQSTLPSAPCE